MALGSIWRKSAETFPVEQEPELTVVRDMNDYPAAARCSSCGEQMPVRQSWITSAAEHLAWFADQFRLHVEEDHPGWRVEP
jgi:hypothetical protein